MRFRVQGVGSHGLGMSLCRFAIVTAAIVTAAIATATVRDYDDGGDDG